jgi:hypothetical protein
MAKGITQRKTQQISFLFFEIFFLVICTWWVPGTMGIGKKIKVGIWKSKMPC